MGLKKIGKRYKVFSISPQRQSPSDIECKSRLLDCATEKPRRDSTAHHESQSKQIRQLARYQVLPESLDKCLGAIHEFVSYVRLNEPGTLRYEVWQERTDPARFVHIFTFRDVDAERIHSESAQVKKFASTLYPECLAPVEFIDYQQFVSNI